MEENQNVVTTPTVEKEGSKFGWGVLGFFIPLVGLILFLVWKNDKKKAAKASGIGALIGFGLGLIFSILFFVFGLGALIGIGTKGDIIDAQATKYTELEDYDFDIKDGHYIVNFFDPSRIIDGKDDNYRVRVTDKNSKVLFYINKTNSKYDIELLSGDKVELVDSLFLDSSSFDFYYINNLLIFSANYMPDNYYFYDMTNGNIVDAFDFSTSELKDMLISNISINDDGSIVFKSIIDAFGFNTATGPKGTITIGVENNYYGSIEDLEAALTENNLGDFIVKREYTYSKKDGKYLSKPSKKEETIKEYYNELTNGSTNTDTKKECTGKVENGKSKYEYKLKFYGDFDSCDTITYKINKDFTVKLGKTDYPSDLAVYVNDVDVTSVLKGVAEANYTMYVAGKTLVTNEFSTDQGANVYLIKPSGEVYSVSGSQALYTLEDGMLMKTYSVNDKGELVITGTRHDNGYGDYFGTQYLTQNDICSYSSFEELAAAYNVPLDYDFKTDYIYTLNDDGLFNLEYSSKKSNQTWSNFYQKNCAR